MGDSPPHRVHPVRPRPRAQPLGIVRRVTAVAAAHDRCDAQAEGEEAMTIATTIRTKLVGPRVIPIDQLEEAGSLHGEPLFRYHGKVYTLTGWNEDMDPHGDGLIVSKPHTAQDGDRELKRPPVRAIGPHQRERPRRHRGTREGTAGEGGEAQGPEAGRRPGMPAHPAGRGDRVVGAGYRGGRPAPHGPAGMMANLASRGIEVSATGEHLIVKAPRGIITTDLREVIETARPLLLAHVKGQPLTCVLCGKEPAATILVGGAPVGERCSLA